MLHFKANDPLSEDRDISNLDAPIGIAEGFLTLSDWVCLDLKQALNPRTDSPPQATKLSF